MLSLYDDIGFVEDFMAVQLKGQLQVIESLSGMPFAFVEVADGIADNMVSKNQNVSPGCKKSYQGCVFQVI